MDFVELDFIEDLPVSEERRAPAQTLSSWARSELSFLHERLKSMEEKCFAKELESLELKKEIQMLEKENLFLKEHLDSVERQIPAGVANKNSEIKREMSEFKKQIFKWFALDMEQCASENEAQLRKNMKRLLLDEIDRE